MSSMSGYVTYIEYQAGIDKGSVHQDDLFNSPFKLGNIDGSYTAQAVVESVTSFVSGTTAVAWNPVEAGTIKLLDANGVQVDDADGAHPATADADGKITQTSFKAGKSASDVAKIAYKYNNIVVPQAKLPMLKAEMKSIPLIAKARRIAVYYSQIAAFQAKTDYGFDLGDQLAEQAVGQLAYEIDTEVVQLLADNAATDAELVWSKTLPVGVSKAEHYEGFSEIIEIGRQKIYDATKRFSPNYMVIASNILPVLTFMKGFTAAPAGKINGPYFAGTLNALKVFVSPAMAAGEFVLGVNGDDMMSSAAVYAPYLPIVPTQLLQYADGGMSEGFSTMYDLRLLNSSLLVKGQLID